MLFYFELFVLCYVTVDISTLCARAEVIFLTRKLCYRKDDRAMRAI